MVRKLAHENIVRVYDWAQDPATSSYFIIMEYLDGQDLDSYLAAHGTCSLQQVLGMLRPVAQALQYAWEKHGLVHRDLKPGNLLLTRQGEIKLLDFGISARLRSNTSPLILPSTRWPNAGTAGYRAPEAGTHQRVFSPALDVYAVAVMMYQMLEGAIPFGEWRNPAQHDQPPSAPLSLSSAQWQVLQRGFAIEPAQRPPSVQALLDAMQGSAPATHGAAPAQAKTAPQAARTVLEQQSIELEAAARLRAAQRRQRKELEQQRRRQASNALHALVEKQNSLHEIEQQQRQQRDDAIRMRAAQNPHAPRLMPDRAVQAPTRKIQADGHDRSAAPIGNNLIESIVESTKAELNVWRTYQPFKMELPSPVQTPAAPLAHMSWAEVLRHLARINHETGQQIRFPTEDEWARVCRASTPKPKL
jgi:serine/threonine protein kinase